jgi:hypothetical protein
LVLAAEVTRELQQSYGLDDVVFTGIQETGRSFGQHLPFYVYALNAEELPRLEGASSLVHSVANRVFQETGIPTSGYVENHPDINVRDYPFLISTKRLSLANGTVPIKVNDTTIDVGVYETARKTTALNLYMRGHKFAIQTLWSRILQEAIERTPGLDYEYDSLGKGIMVTVNQGMIRDYLPRWADKGTREAALECMKVSKDALQKLTLKDMDFPLFEPVRYVDLDPRVGMDGTAHALTPVRTKMSCPPQLNLWFLRKRLYEVVQEWSRSHNKLALQFHIQRGKMRLKPNSVHLDVILDQATDNEIEQARAFFEDQGIKVSAELQRLIEEARNGGLARVRPHHLSAGYQRKETYIVPIKLLVPIITQENWYLFSKIIKVEGGNERVPKIYQTLTKYNSETLACLNHAIANALAAELRPKLLWEGGETTVNFVPGPLTLRTRGADSLNIAGFQTVKINVPTVAVKNADTGALKWVQPGELYDVAKGDAYPDEPLEILSKPEQFEKRLKVAIIHPDFRGNSSIQTLLGGNRGPRICEAIVTGNLDIIDPEGRRRSQERGNKDPLKNSDRILKAMYSFFGYNPKNITSRTYKVEDTALDTAGNPSGYLEKMEEALQDDSDLFIVFLPSSNLKYVRDRTYYATYGFAFQHNKQVIHYRPGTWKGRMETYALAYSLLAHMTKRFGGSIYATNTSELWSKVRLPPEYETVRKPLSVYVDFGPWNGSSVGLITAAGNDFASSTCMITLQADNNEDLFGRIDDTLSKIIKNGHYDLLLTMRDSGFRQAELMRVSDVADQTSVPTLAVSTTRSGGLSAWKFRKGYARDRLSVTAPYGTALLTPDDAVELFPHNTGLEYEESGGLWKSIRLRKEQAYPATIRVDPEWIAHLGLCLSSTADYMSDPTRMKYPSFLAKASKLNEFILNGVFADTPQRIDSSIGTILSFNSGQID